MYIAPVDRNVPCSFLIPPHNCIPPPHAHFVLCPILTCPWIPVAAGICDLPCLVALWQYAVGWLGQPALISIAALAQASHCNKVKSLWCSGMLASRPDSRVRVSPQRQTRQAEAARAAKEKSRTTTGRRQMMEAMLEGERE